MLKIAPTLDKNLISISSVILYLLPITILTGPFLPDLSIVILSIIFFYLTIKSKKWKYYNNSFFIFFIVFYVYLLIASILSDFKYFSLEASLFYFRFIIFSLSVWFIIENNKSFIKTFSSFLIATFIFILVDGYLQFFFEYSTFNLAPTVNDRLNLSFNDKAILGGYISRLFPLLLALVIYNYALNKKTLSFYFIILILTDILVYLSGERTAIGILFISNVYIIILISKFQLLRFLSLLFSILAMIIISLSSPDVMKRNIEHTLNQMNLNSTQYDILMFSPEHDSMYRTSFNMFIKNPLIGVGPKNFRKLCDKDIYKFNERSCSTHPHNSYFQILSETGIIGFAFIFCLILYVSKESMLHMQSIFTKRHRRLSDYQVCLMACFVCTLFPFLPTQNLFNNWINIIYFLPVGFFLQTILKKSDS